jgi:RNA polymerase primary sigma factor
MIRRQPAPIRPFSNQTADVSANLSPQAITERRKNLRTITGMQADSPFDAVVKVDLKLAVNAVLSTLPPRWAEVIRLRFIDSNLTQNEVSKQLGVSKNRISQIEIAAFKRLRNPRNARNFKDFA